MSVLSSSADSAVAPPVVQREQAIVRVSRSVVEGSAELVRDATALVAETLGLTRFGIVDSREDGAHLRLFHTGQNEPDAERCYPLGETTCLAPQILSRSGLLVAENLEAARVRDRFLHQQGIVGAMGMPLSRQGRHFGAMLVLLERHQTFSEDDRQFLQTIANLVLSGLACQSAEQQLARAEHVNSAMLDAVDALVLMLDHEARITNVNRACCQTTGFTTAELRDRSLWNALLLPEDVPVFQDVLEELRKPGATSRLESHLLTKQGQRRRIAWSFGVVPPSGGQPSTILGTGVDITELRAAEDQAARAQATAKQSARLLTDLLERLDQEGGTQARRQPFQETPSSGSERRNRPRRSYPYRQRVASMRDGQLPEPHQFQEVECRDIGGGGFSFVSPLPPGDEKLIVALGNAPALTYVQAEVAHVTAVESNGSTSYTVGCRYLGRVNYPA